jgi:hypothetical protein
VLAKESDADGREIDARLAHEIDAEEGDETHPGRDCNEVRGNHYPDAAI